MDRTPLATVTKSASQAQARSAADKPIALFVSR
jgi:hypothetical protein